MRVALERMPEPDRNMVLIKQVNYNNKIDTWSIVMIDFFWSTEDRTIYDLLKKHDNITCELVPIEQT